MALHSNDILSPIALQRNIIDSIHHSYLAMCEKVVAYILNYSYLTPFLCVITCWSATGHCQKLSYRLFFTAE